MSRDVKGGDTDFVDGDVGGGAAQTWKLWRWEVQRRGPIDGWYTGVDGWKMCSGQDWNGANGIGERSGRGVDGRRAGEYYREKTEGAGMEWQGMVQGKNTGEGRNEMETGVKIAQVRNEKTGGRRMMNPRPWQKRTAACSSRSS